MNKGEKIFANEIFDTLTQVPIGKKGIGIVEGKYLDRCPVCNAPLFKRTPVKCEYCGILIEK